jgi:hypothetical protein
LSSVAACFFDHPFDEPVVIAFTAPGQLDDPDSDSFTLTRGSCAYSWNTAHFLEGHAHHLDIFGLEYTAFQIRLDGHRFPHSRQSCANAAGRQSSKD